MSFKLGIAGPENTGKSFSQRTIPDGENVFMLMPSLKATYLKKSTGEVVGNFGIKTKDGRNLQQTMAALKAPTSTHLISYFNSLPPGTFKSENITGNIEVVGLNDLPIWLEFVSRHLPWIHTLIMPDFTHFISAIISKPDFIERKAGGDAYQKFWELAGAALNKFILNLDNYRRDLLIITEYHADFDEATGGYQIFVPSGKMLTDKFKIPSYYDYLFFTDVKGVNVGEDNESSEYRFVTRATKKYPKARAMNKFAETYIPNDLNTILKVVRPALGI